MVARQRERQRARILRAAAEWLRAFDPTRPVQYESGIGEAIFTTLVAGATSTWASCSSRPTPESDVIAPMYPEVRRPGGVGDPCHARTGR